MPRQWFDHTTSNPFDRWLELQDLEKAMPPVEQRAKAPVRVTRSPQPPPPSPAAPTPVSRKPHVYRHGDAVQFRHANVTGQGKLVASDMNSVTVRTADGREHTMKHQALVEPAVWV